MTRFTVDEATPERVKATIRPDCLDCVPAIVSCLLGLMCMSIDKLTVRKDGTCKITKKGFCGCKKRIVVNGPLVALFFSSRVCVFSLYPEPLPRWQVSRGPKCSRTHLRLDSESDLGSGCTFFSSLPLIFSCVCLLSQWRRRRFVRSWARGFCSPPPHKHTDRQRTQTNKHTQLHCTQANSTHTIISPPVRLGTTVSRPVLHLHRGGTFNLTSCSQNCTVSSPQSPFSLLVVRALISRFSCPDNLEGMSELVSAINCLNLQAPWRAPVSSSHVSAPRVYQPSRKSLRAENFRTRARAWYSQDKDFVAQQLQLFLPSKKTSALLALFYSHVFSPQSFGGVGPSQHACRYEGGFFLFSSFSPLSSFFSFFFLSLSLFLSSFSSPSFSLLFLSLLSLSGSPFKRQCGSMARAFPARSPRKPPT